MNKHWNHNDNKYVHFCSRVGPALADTAACANNPYENDQAIFRKQCKITLHNHNATKLNKCEKINWPQSTYIYNANKLATSTRKKKKHCAKTLERQLMLQDQQMQQKESFFAYSSYEPIDHKPAFRHIEKGSVHQVRQLFKKKANKISYYIQWQTFQWSITACFALFKKTRGSSRNKNPTLGIAIDQAYKRKQKAYK